MEKTIQDSASNLEEKRIGISLQTKNQDFTKYSRAISPLITTTLKVHPACLEFAPANISHEYPEYLRTKVHEYFVVGTYQLAEELKGNDEKTAGLSDDKHQERIGGVSLFRFQNSGAEPEL
jgi:hypothetical protein